MTCLLSQTLTRFTSSVGDLILGDTPPDKIYLGANEVAAMYLGADRVWRGDFDRGDYVGVGKTVLFEKANSQYMQYGSVSGNRQISTFSAWIKQLDNAAQYALLSCGADNNNFTNIEIDTTGGIRVQHQDGGADHFRLVSSLLLRDFSAPFHLVVAFDTTQGVDTDRVKVYINGVHITDWASASWPNQNKNLDFNSGDNHELGRKRTGVNYSNLYTSDVYWVDGLQLTPDDFGRYSADVSNWWVPKTFTGVYGINGCRLTFANDNGDDFSGNANTWTPNGAPTYSFDIPGDNFCTLNAIDPLTTGTLSNGNLTVSGNATVTIRPDTGKWYYEKDGVGVNYDTGVSGTFDPLLPTGTYNFGATTFVGTPDPDFLPISSANLPEPAVLNPQEHANILLYTGDSINPHAITGAGFAPDFVWMKRRTSAAISHALFDIIREPKQVIESDTADVEAALNQGLLSFDLDGFTLGTSAQVNQSAQDYWSFPFLAGGAPVTNNDGSIETKVSANVLAGCSVIEYVGTGLIGTVGHGLPSPPDFFFIKNLDDARDWVVYHADNTNTPEQEYVVLNEDAASVNNAGIWQNTKPDSSVIYLGTNNRVNTLGERYVAYCFAFGDVFAGGSYIGNGDVDGTFIPDADLLMSLIKQTDGVQNWVLNDTERVPYNPNDVYISPNLPDAEVTGSSSINYDFDSNGLKLRSDSVSINGNGNGYIYFGIKKKGMFAT